MFARNIGDGQFNDYAEGGRRGYGTMCLQPTFHSRRRSGLVGKWVNGEDNKTYFNHVNAALDLKPHITMDDGADLVSEIHKKRRELIKNVKAGTEETTTGVIRLKALAKQKK